MILGILNNVNNLNCHKIKKKSLIYNILSLTIIVRHKGIY